MREAQRANLIIVAALATIVGALGLYASWVWSWFSPSTTPIVTHAPKATPVRPEELIAARASFREAFLDPRAHIRLADGLFRAGLPVDSFYVLSFARTFFGETAFLRAHAFVTLHQGAHFLGGEEFDPSPANETRLRSRLRDDPSNPDLINYLAHIQASRGDAAGALKALDEALRTRPEEPSLLAYRAHLTSLGGDGPGALPFYARLAAAAPDSHEGRTALETLGRVARGRGEGSDPDGAVLARDALSELARRFPDHPGVFSALALSSLARGEDQPVRSLVSETLSRKPKHAGALQVSGALALQDRNPELALKLFTAAWELNPADLYSAERLAQLYMKQRADPEASLPYYLAIHRQYPRYEDEEAAELVIRRILDGRREQLLKGAQASDLKRFLYSEDASLRAEACVRAAQLQDPLWIEALAELLDDDTEIVRHNADYALYQLGQKHADAIHVRRMDWIGSPKPLVRIRALNLFADLTPKDNYPLVIRALYDPHPAVRFLAKVMVLDHYYKDYPQAAKAREDYLASEKDETVLSLYARLKSGRGS